MPSRFSASRPLFAILVIAIAGAAALAVYRETLHYGFDYDDYHFVRPYPPAEIGNAFHGPWDPVGIEVPFYRPITIAFFALRFEWLGLNASAYHALSLGMFALSAALAAWLVYRLTGRRSAAIVCALLFVCHPAMTYSLVAWVTNQMHLLATIVVLSALLWWHLVRHKPLAWWLPLLGFAAAAFTIKEDGVMLLPVIIAVHTLTRLLLERSLPPVSWKFLVLAVATIALLMFVRSNALHGLGGYGRLTTVQSAWHNLFGGLNGIFRLIPADRPWQPAASAFVTLLPVVALLAWRWISPAARLCLVGGLVIAILFDLPFIFVSKAEQAHFLGFGAVVTLTGGVIALFDLVRTRSLAWSFAPLAVVAPGILSLGLVARDVARDFDPFGPYVLSHDEIVQTWWPVPPELKDYVARKREPGSRRISPNPVDEVSRVSFGLMGPETDPNGRSIFWMAGARAEIHVAADVRSITIPIRHQIEAFREPARATIEVDGRRMDELLLDHSRWQEVRATFRPGSAGLIRRMHRIRITIDHAWQPSRVIPGSADERILGLQIGELTLR